MKRAGLLLLLMAGIVAADDIYYIGGGPPFAKNVMILREGGGKVTWIDKNLKERSFQKSSIGKILRKRTPVHEAYERYESAKDAATLIDLAEWAKKKRFGKSALTAIYMKAVKFDPKNAIANEALGYVEYKGEWMSPMAKRAREDEDRAAAMEAKGLVQWKDQWVTPEDKAKLEQGLRKYKGRWMTEDEVKEAEGFVKYDGKWVKKAELATLELIGPARRDTGLGDALRFTQTEHFVVLGDLPDPDLAKLGQTMERLYAEWKRIFPDTNDANMLAESKYRLFAFRKARPYQVLVRAMYDRLKDEGGHGEAFMKREEARMKVRKRETSFWEILPAPESAHVQMPDPFEGLRAHCVHFATNVLATRYSRVRFPTWWLNEGLAYYFEKKITGGVQTFSADVGGTKYADQGPGDAKQNPWFDAAKWNNLLLQLVRGGRDTALDRMKGKNLYEQKNKLTIQELAKSYSVVSYLIQDDVKKFAAFVYDAKNGSGASDVERETAAVIKHYGSYRKIDEGWKQYALNGFRLVR